MDVLGLCRLHFTTSSAFTRSSADLVDITLLEMHSEVVVVVQIGPSSLKFKNSPLCCAEIQL